MRDKNIQELDGCIVWNEHNTVFGSKVICTQTVYFLHLTMRSVTCLRLSDLSVFCRVSYFKFLIQVCCSSMSVRQATLQIGSLSAELQPNA